MGRFNGPSKLEPPIDETPAAGEDVAAAVSGNSDSVTSYQKAHAKALSAANDPSATATEIAVARLNLLNEAAKLEVADVTKTDVDGAPAEVVRMPPGAQMAFDSMLPSIEELLWQFALITREWKAQADEVIDAKKTLKEIAERREMIAAQLAERGEKRHWEAEKSRIGGLRDKAAEMVDDLARKGITVSITEGRSDVAVIDGKTGEVLTHPRIASTSAPGYCVCGAAMDSPDEFHNSAHGEYLRGLDQWREPEVPAAETQAAEPKAEAARKPRGGKPESNVVAFEKATRA